jgi:flagellar biosynthesis protein FlhF
MIIKKFSAPTMTEALAKVREELGPEAIIMNTRSEKKGGVFDFVGKALVEVTAAVDEKPIEGKGRGDQSARTAPVSPAEARQYPPDRPVSYEPPQRGGFHKPPSEAEIKTLGERLDLDHIMDDIRELKRSIKTLADNSLAGDMDGLSGNARILLANMLNAGIDDKIAKRLIRQIINELSPVELADSAAIARKASELLLEGIGEVSPILMAGAKPRIIAFVGPTGSGKTTTIAKLATDFTLHSGKKVAVLSIDTKRVDAVGQLKAYCRIINIPLFIAYSPEDLPGLMPGIMNSDITLVDTPGSGPMDRQQMIEMIEFLQKMVPQEVHLAISVTTSLADMKKIFENFSLLKPNRILFTKLDETEYYGPLISFAILSKKPLSYVTFGQSVPGDFALVDPPGLIQKILNGASTSSMRTDKLGAR